jgi:two-component system chemotaxis response regulator CheY
MTPESPLVNRFFLVVDDEEFVRRVVVRYLTQAGAAGVVEASDGSAAIAAIHASPMSFDAVVTDLNMRPMNGLALLKAIRVGENGLKRNMPVIMLTAHAEATYVAQALALDADSFVVKPVSKEDVLSRVARVVERRSPLRAADDYRAVELGDRFYDSYAAAPRATLTLVRSEPSPAAATAAAAVAAESPAAEPAAAGPRTRRIPLELVAPDSILGADVYAKDGNAKFLSARTVLTAPLLARLLDLRELNSALNTLTILEEPA